METSSREKTHILFVMLMLLCFQQVHDSNAQEDLSYKEIPVGVILDTGSFVGKTVENFITMAVSDFYMVNTHYQTRIVVHNRDSHGMPLHALSAALDLLEKPKVQAIIGSESTAEAKLLAVLGDKARVPILSLSPCLSSNKHPYFLQVTHDETTQFKGIAAMAESLGWKDVILIGEDSDNGRDMTAFMTSTFQTKSIRITHRSLISSSSSNELLQEELQNLSTMQTKIFIMHASPSLASRLMLNAKYLGMMDDGYKWIITGKTMNFLYLMDDEAIESMQGAVGFKSYVPQSRDILHKFIYRWIKEYHAKNPVMKNFNEINTYATWAYDTVSALAMAFERIQAVEQVKKLKIKDSETGLTQRGTALLNQMLSMLFHGLGGAFHLKKGKITAEVLEIINVIGNDGERRIGFWTIDAAFSKKMGKMNSFSGDGLESIIWPGGITSNPPHRLLQGSRKNLRIGVPLQTGRVFQAIYDAETNSTMVSGFCAEVFQTAFTALHLDVSFQFIPFMEEEKDLNYNDLIDRVYAGEFDAAIGDITITANRSMYVDFTLPFTDLGLGTLYRNSEASMWIFMKPLSSDLWIVSACFFILMGFVIWILEHRTNEEFQGSLTQQIGTTFWFAFSTLVFAHRQKLQNNMSRFVVTVWLFVVLVLVSSYTATLSSLLTIEQIQLASKGDSIGYRGAYFVERYIRNYNFKDTRLRPYSTPKDYADALSYGNKKGGVDAIIDEIPYLKEFLSRYPSGYSMVVSQVTTNGFGFVFQKGSTLAPELSRQISRLREDGTLKLLENKWFRTDPDPQSNDSEPLPKILNLKGCRGLFLISGVSMAVALFIFLLFFIREKLHFTSTSIMLAGGKLAFIISLLKPRNVG